jgi:hypothetical protein
MVDIGRSRSVRAPVVEENLLDVVDGYPSLITRRLSVRPGVLHCVVYRTLLYLYDKQWFSHFCQLTQMSDLSSANDCFISVPRILPP